MSRTPFKLGDTFFKKRGSIYTLISREGNILTLSCDKCTEVLGYTFTSTQTTSSVRKDTLSCCCKYGHKLIDRYLMKSYYDLEGEGCLELSKEIIVGDGYLFEKVLWKDLQGNLFVELGIGSGYSTLIDLEDFVKVEKFNWKVKKYANKYVSVYCSQSSVKSFLHKIVKPFKINTDHINKVFPESAALDNRKVNLRPYTQQENMHNVNYSSRNISGTIGVSWIEKQQGYKVRFSVNRKPPFQAWFPVKRYGNKLEAEKAAILGAKLYKLLVHNGHNLVDLLDETEDTYIKEMLLTLDI